MKSSWVRLSLISTIVVAAALSLSGISGAAPAKTRRLVAHKAAAHLVLKVWDIFYFPKQSGSVGARGKSELAIDQAFMKKYPNITVQHVGVPGTDFFTDINEFVAARSGPDVITDGGNTLPSNSGWTKAMYPMYKLVSPTLKQQLGGYLTGEAIGDPAHYSIPDLAGVYNFYYNKHDFLKAGIAAPPTTFAQLLGDCTALTKVGITPITNGFSGYGNVTPFMYGPGNQVLSMSALEGWETFKVAWTDPRMVSGLNDWQVMAQNGCFGNPSTAATTDVNDGVNAFVGGQGGMVFWYGLNAATFGSGTSNVGVFPFPKVPNSAYPAGTPDAGYNANWSIMNYTKVCAAAWDYVSFWDSPQAQQIQWKVAGIIPVNSAVKIKTSNGIDAATVALARNKYAHHGIGELTSTQEVNLLAQLMPELVTGSITPQALATQLQAVRSTVTAPPVLTKLPNPPPCVNGKSVAG